MSEPRVKRFEFYRGALFWNYKQRYDLFGLGGNPYDPWHSLTINSVYFGFREKGEPWFQNTTMDYEMFHGRAFTFCGIRFGKTLACISKPASEELVD